MICSFQRPSPFQTEHHVRKFLFNSKHSPSCILKLKIGSPEVYPFEHNTDPVYIHKDNTLPIVADISANMDVNLFDTIPISTRRAISAIPSHKLNGDLIRDEVPSDNRLNKRMGLDGNAATSNLSKSNPDLISKLPHLFRWMRVNQPLEFLSGDSRRVVTAYNWKLLFKKEWHECCILLTRKSIQTEPQSALRKY
ncbi:hypothetical protein AYI68_g2539 [Smittium mucronatum]|uniref:Uncharacterized protein n=1 Tax=Smittium mucronatum TaxID=133383 RepID=A0A1R0H2E9_9FUNG|nr:hypothetical protein AYI68_g2539 [Smittium mucronatum]